MYIFGKFKNVDGTSVDGVTTIISSISENENGLIFTASSYFDEYQHISVGMTVPFRAWNYFCSFNEEENETRAYNYLMTQEEFSGCQLMS